MTSNLASLVQPDFYHIIPLPNPPICTEPANLESLFSGSASEASVWQSTARPSDEELAAEAERITRLLEDVDVSYIKIRDEARSAMPIGESRRGSLRAAVESMTSGGFNLFSPGKSKRKSPPGIEVTTSLVNSSTIKTQCSQEANELEPAQAAGTVDHMDPGRSKLKRRRTSVAGRTSQRDKQVSRGTTAGDDPLLAFTEMLEEMFDKSDTITSDHSGGASHGLLSNREMSCLFGELLRLKADSRLQSIPPATLLRTMTLLDRHIMAGSDVELDAENDESDANARIILSLEGVQAAITVMAAPNMPKQVYSEEIIENIVHVIKFHILHHIFPSFDANYRLVHGEHDEDDKESGLEITESGTPSKKKSKSKSKPVGGRKTTVCKGSKPVMELLNKVCGVVASLSELLTATKLHDATLLQLTKIFLASFEVENVELLQLKCLVVMCTVFKHYPQHRTIIMDEVVSLLWKLPTCKRNLRTYHLSEDRKQIQMTSALLIHLLQCSVELPEAATDAIVRNASEIGSQEGSADQKLKCFDHALQITKQFWQPLLDRWASPKVHEGVDVKGVFENLVTDLLECLDVPELPASNFLLQILCLSLLSGSGLQSKDQIIRGAAVELLGCIASRLKKNDLICANDRLWILDDADPAHGATTPRSKKEICTACGEKRGRSASVTCVGCQRSFHVSCVAVDETVFMEGRGWLCQCCFCQQQLTTLVSTLESRRGISGREKTDVSTLGDGNVTKPTLPSQWAAEGSLVLQQVLLNHLQVSRAQGDAASTYARSFYLCWWYSEGKDDKETPDFYHARLQAAMPANSFGYTTPLKREVIVRVALELAQTSNLARGFDKILQGILMIVHDNSTTPRVKALKAIGTLVETSPTMLEDERVKLAVEKHLKDSAISVREAAVDLVGKYMMLSPNVALKYYDKIAERTRDTGLSVRKKVIKIIKDVILSIGDFPKKIDACTKIMERITDDETSIRDLVVKVFHELWFEEHQFAGSRSDANGNTADVIEQTKQVVEVLKSPAAQLQLVTIVKRILHQDANPQTIKGGNNNLIPQGAIRRKCEIMCKCMLEGVLQAYEESAGENEAKALPYVTGLQSFCIVDPSLCAPPSDTSRFALTLQPYLKTQPDDEMAAASFVQCVLYIIDSVLPLLRRPSATFLDELDRDLRQMIVTHRYPYVIQSCVKCLCSLSKIHVKSMESIKLLIHYHYKKLNEKPTQVDEKSQLASARFLSLLGLLARYAADAIDQGLLPNVNRESIIDIYLSYLKFDNFGVKIKALQGLGNVILSKPQLFLRIEMRELLQAALMQKADDRLKRQTLLNLLDYLHDVESKLALGGNPEQASSALAVVGGELPVAAGAGDLNNNCGGIVQLYWDKILERVLDLNVEVRQTALKVIEIVLRQGLVHPVTSVPALIALEVDQNESNAKLANRLLMMMHEKHPQFIENRLGDGLHASFQFMRSGAAASGGTGAADCGKTSATDWKAATPLFETSKEGIARVYRLVRNTRTSRNKFIGSVIRKFDGTHQMGAGIDLAFLRYCTEVLASLPFEIPDEPLYVIYSINRIVQIRCGPLQSVLKDSIFGSGELAELAAKELAVMQTENAGQENGTVNILVAEDSQVEGDIPSSQSGSDTLTSLDTAMERVKNDCTKAMAMSLLLLLKNHFKYTYNLPDARCKAFQPSEAMAKGEALLRRDTGPIPCDSLPLRVAGSIRDILTQYQSFKNLLKDDSTSDFAGFATHGNKRRSSGVGASAAAVGVGVHASVAVDENGKHVHGASVTGNGLQAANGHAVGRAKRRYSLPGHELGTPESPEWEGEGEEANGGKRRQSLRSRRRTSTNGTQKHGKR